MNSIYSAHSIWIFSSKVSVSNQCPHYSGFICLTRSQQFSGGTIGNISSVQFSSIGNVCSEVLKSCTYLENTCYLSASWSDEILLLQICLDATSTFLFVCSAFVPFACVYAGCSFYTARKGHKAHEQFPFCQCCVWKVRKRPRMREHTVQVYVFVCDSLTSALLCLFAVNVRLQAIQWVVGAGCQRFSLIHPALGVGGTAPPIDKTCNSEYIYRLHSHTDIMNMIL